MLAMCGWCSALTMSFYRITDNASDDVSNDIFLEVTDLGSGMALFELSRGDTYEGLIGEVYFQTEGTNIIGVEFDPVFSAANVVYTSGASPADPPASNTNDPPDPATFITSYSFDSHNSEAIQPEADLEYGGFKATYSGTYDDLETALFNGEVKLAVHVRGIGSQSDTFITGIPTTTIPEPSVALLTAMGSFFLLRRRRQPSA
ncbi:hypothetical protein HAHE_42940 [Haloferula helveola]|uniref:PEP-CTERM protein-sorting domain-containing protein n=2 Tax=Haloferula helveola TaxID=490095 RepID=A0ABN6H9N4_9BACT|nr:hypothetical protein HAHE_42940 [Haloferula helveola]